MLDAVVWISKPHFKLVKTFHLIVNFILSCQIITKVIWKDLTGIMNICIKSRANQTDRGRDMPLDKRRFWPVGGAEWQVRDSPKSVAFIPWVPRMYVPKALAVHPVAGEIQCDSRPALAALQPC